MALEVESLLAEFDHDLGSAVSASVHNSQAVDNLYEAYLYGMVLRAARAIDSDAVRWHNLVGPKGDEVRLRGGPGEVYSPNFSFATLRFNGETVFEVHQGVKILGESGVAHECDIAALHAGRGAWRRARKERPRPTDMFFAVEAKAYQATRLGLGIGRAVVGLRADLQQHRIALVAATAIDDSARRLVDSWSAGAFPEVMPGAAGTGLLLTRLNEVLLS
jgi:hypothetical protein